MLCIYKRSCVLTCFNVSICPNNLSPRPPQDAPRRPRGPRETPWYAPGRAKTAQDGSTETDTCSSCSLQCALLGLARRDPYYSSLCKTRKPKRTQRCSRLLVYVGDHSINQAIDQSTNQPINLSINQSISPSSSQSISQSINQSVSQSINRSINQWINRSIDQSVIQTLNQSIHQPIHQSIIRSINQSINNPDSFVIQYWHGGGVCRRQLDIYVCKCVYIYTQKYIHKCIREYIYIYVYISMYLYIYI